ncbi:MAG: peptide chain release factor N(5)-glutamine methyltransferase [Desulfosarcina sp.]|nr:peptide chain release factor N(5)-glutamine methyltransferase [Desulfobacterales bacterium]
MLHPEWTILSILEWTTGYFRKGHIESPRLDAEILLAHSLGLRRIDLYLRYDQPLGADERAAFKRIVKRRAAREPVAYIVGQKEFWGLDFIVGPDVLTPRPETERLVEVAVESLQSCPERETPRVLDLGTGSGCIAVALAHSCPTVQVDASDLSRPALALARQNIERHRLADRIRLVAGAGLDMLDKTRPIFDAIVSNPPYIPSADIEALQAEVKDYEPRGALDGGDDGLDLYRRIIPEAAPGLLPGGALILEIGWDQGAAVQRLAEESGCYQGCACLADYSGHDRVMRLLRA